MTPAMQKLLQLSMQPGLQQLSVDETRELMKDNIELVDEGVLDALAQLSKGESPEIVLSILDTSKSLINRNLIGMRRIHLPDSPEIEKTIILAQTRPHSIENSLRAMERVAVCNFFITHTSEVWILMCQDLGKEREIGYAAFQVVSKDTANDFHSRLSEYITSLSGSSPDVSALDCLLQWFGSVIIPFFFKYGIPNKLVFIPHRSLHLLPFHAMYVNTGKDTIYLDRMIPRISYASCIPELTLGTGHMDSAKSNKNREPRLLAVLDTAASELKWIEQERKHYEVFRMLSLPVDVFTVGQRIPQDLSSYVAINWSSHGKSDPSSWAGSFLTFGESKIKAVEIAEKWNLANQPIVTLAACETALDTSVATGPDEYCGLDFGFRIAGASTVFATLWPVADPVAALGSIVLFDWVRTHNVSPSEALVRFQIGLRMGTWWNWMLSDEQIDTIPEELGAVRPLLKERRESFLSIPADAFSDIRQWGVFRCIGRP